MRIITKLADRTPGAFLVGIEIPASRPDLLSGVNANIDPQHGGGCWGLPHPEAYPKMPQRTAAGWALGYVAGVYGGTGGWTYGQNEYLALRPDLDTLSAIAVLESRTGISISRELLKEFEDLDDGTSAAPGTWAPSDDGTWARPVTVEDHPRYAGISLLCLAGHGFTVPGVPPLPLEERVRHVADFWQGITSEEVFAADAIWRKGRSQLRTAAQITTASEGVAIVKCDLPGAFSLAYARAPVAICVAGNFRFPSGVTGTKLTLGVHPGAAPEIREKVVRVAWELARLEIGWGGNPAAGIWGSPQSEPSRLNAGDVLSVLRQYGI